MRHLLTATIVLLLISPTALPQDLLFRVFGPTSSRFGCAVDGAGDVNGDGVLDFIVGAGDSGNVGAAFVYSGRDGSLLQSFLGDVSGARLGDAVSRAGDVNDDGYDDVIVGAPANTDGYARVYSGRDGALLHHFAGKGSGNGFGRSVSEMGDIDGDGFADVAVGGTPTSFGYVTVFSGRDGSVLLDLVRPGCCFGDSVANAGDLNGDGIPDLLAGDPGRGVGGSLTVFSGANGAVLLEVFESQSFAFLGWSAAGAGDVNGDGVPDLLGGSISYDATYTDQGRVLVFSGKDGSRLWDFSGEGFNDSFGWSVAGVGDIDGDGLADVMGGTFDSDSYPSPHGYVKIFAGSDGHVIRRHDSTRDAYGNSCGAVGDVNGDGFPEVIVGAPFEDSFRGMVLLYSGREYQASFANYGEGWPGTDDVPDFTANYLPNLCSEITLTVGNSRGAPTRGVIFVGLSTADLPTAWGGTLWLLPMQTIPLNMPATGFAPIIQIPCDIAFMGVSVYLQLLEEDPGASLGVSFSRALELTLGLGKDE